MALHGSLIGSSIIRANVINKSKMIISKVAPSMDVIKTNWLDRQRYAHRQKWCSTMPSTIQHDRMHCSVPASKHQTTDELDSPIVLQQLASPLKVLTHTNSKTNREKNLKEDFYWDKKNTETISVADKCTFGIRIDPFGNSVRM